MTALTDEKLVAAFSKGIDDLDGLRAVAEAAVKAEREGQEPVAWKIFWKGEWIVTLCSLDREFAERKSWNVVPLYTTPPAAPVPEGWVKAVQEFVDRVERDELRSRYTYAKFKALLAASQQDAVPKHKPECNSLTMLLPTHPPQPARCNCGAGQPEVKS